MAILTPTPKQQFFAANGAPLVGGKLYSYVAGTTKEYRQADKEQYLADYPDRAADVAAMNW